MGDVRCERVCECMGGRDVRPLCSPCPPGLSAGGLFERRWCLGWGSVERVAPPPPPRGSTSPSRPSPVMSGEGGGGGTPGRCYASSLTVSSNPWCHPQGSGSVCAIVCDCVRVRECERASACVRVRVGASVCARAHACVCACMRASVRAPRVIHTHHTTHTNTLARSLGHHSPSVDPGS